MRKSLLACVVAALAVMVALPDAAHAIQAEVRLAPLSRSGPPPRLRDREGWLTISNRDWQDYTLRIEKERIFLTQGSFGQGWGTGFGEYVIRSGSTITISLPRDTYKLYGNNSDRLNVRVREGRTTTLSLEPFGFVGSTGLMAVVNDGDRVRNEVIIDAFQPPVVVTRPPTVIVERPRPVPPPPPVIINRPPVIIGGGHGPSRPGNRPPSRPPQRPPHHGGRNDGWGFTFGFSSN